MQDFPPGRCSLKQWSHNMGLDVQSARVGPQSAADGSFLFWRCDKQGNLTTTQAHGKYYEPTSRGNVFGACVAAGAAPGATISTTAHLVLYNPPTSGKRLSVQKVRTAYVSGTL